MKTFEGLKAGTIIHNSIDGDMVVVYSDWFNETEEKELCFQTDDSLWRGTEFDPTDWEQKQ